MSHLPQSDKSPVQLNFLNMESSLFNESTGLWATYADAAGAQPVDGTGGSPIVTITRSESSPLKSPASLNFVKDANNRQGQGVSIEFSTDPAYRSRILTISFDYLITTGTYVTGDLTIYLVDVTNGTVIQPSGYQIQNIVAGSPGRHVASFQTSSSGASYRLCLHVATVSSANYTFQLDNFQVGTQSVSGFGTPITDWISYTPTGSLTTNATYTGKYRRIGDSAEIEARISFSGTNTDNATGTFSLPSGLSIDTTKILSSASDNQSLAIGTVTFADVSVTTYHGAVVYNNTTQVSLRYFVDDSGTGTNLIQTTAFNPNTTPPFTIASGDFVLARFLVPITGWSSSIIMSNDTDTRTVAARYSSTAGQSIANATAVIVDYGTKDYDTHGAVTTGATWKFTAPIAGKYHVSALIQFVAGAGWDATEGAQIILYKNNTATSYLGEIYAQTTHSSIMEPGGSDTINLVAGDFIDVRAVQNSGASRSLTTDNLRVRIAIERISESGTIATTETVTARYSTDAAANVVTGTIVNFEDKDYDSHGAVTIGASWKFTAPISGIYRLNSRWITQAATASSIGDLVGFRLSINAAAASRYVAIAYAITTSSIAKQSSGATDIRLLAGDTISIIGLNNTGSTHTLSASGDTTFIEIIRVGNY